MLLTGIELTKGKPELLRCFFYDEKILRFQGPVSFPRLRLLVSRPDSLAAINYLLDEIRKEFGNVKAEIKKYKQNKSILHVYCNVDKAKKIEIKKKGKLFATMPKAIAYYTHNFFLTEFKFSENINSALGLQKKVNSLMRELYFSKEIQSKTFEEYLNQKINEKGGIEEKIEKILQNKNAKEMSPKSINNLSEIVKYFNKMKELTNSSKDDSLIDFNKVRCDIIILNNSSYQRFENSDFSLDLERLIVANDTELGDYTSDNPQMYLSCYVYKEGGVTIGISHIGDTQLNTETKKFTYINAKTSDGVRKVSGDFLNSPTSFGVDRDFVCEVGFNNCAFDRQKFYNPKRGKKDLASGDGIFRPAPDNSGVIYEGKSAGNERFNSHGTIPLDLYLFSKTNFRSFLPDLSLVSVLNLLDRFTEEDIQYDKMFTTYKETEQMYREWISGNIEAGRKNALYCQEDTIGHYNVGKFFIDVIMNISKILKLHPYDVCNLNIKRNAQEYWSKRTFNNINYFRTFIKTNKKDSKYAISDPNDLLDIISDTEIYEFFKRKKLKMRLFDYSKKFGLKISEEKGLIGDVDCYYAGFLGKIVSDYVNIKEINQIKQILNNEHNPIKKLCYSNWLEAVVSEFFVDMKKAKINNNKIFVMGKYGIREPEFMETFKNMLEENLKEISFLLEDKVIFFNGEIMYTKNLDEENRKNLRKLGFTHLSKAKLLKVDDESAIADIGELMFATGISIPSKKKRFYTAAEDVKNSLLDIKIQYDFIKALFENKEKAKEVILEYIKKIENNEVPALDYIKTIKLEKNLDEYLDQNSKEIIAAKKLGLEFAGDIGFFAYGSLDNETGFIKYEPSEKENFEKNFKPDIQKYYEKIFDKKRNLARIYKAVFNEDIAKLLESKGIILEE